MIYWAPFLHFYQPPTQSHAILKKVYKESYKPLLKMLLGHPTAKVTINICGVLTETLNEHGASDIIEHIRDLAKNDQLEFVDSAKYHAILPLIPPTEMQRQIELNHETNLRFFKKEYKTRGFFPPEMCYSNDVASLLTRMGYGYFLISGVACPEKWPLDVIYKIIPDKSSEINVFYRDDILSNKISFCSIDGTRFISELVNLSRGKKDIYVITAFDAETFGHHIKNWEKLFLADVYEWIDDLADRDGNIKQKRSRGGKHKRISESYHFTQIKVVTISELFKKFPIKSSKKPKPSSWSTAKEDIIKRNYYPLWNGQNNPIHGLQWEHVETCLELLREAAQARLKGNKESRNFYNISRDLLDKALHSCQFWWANRGGMWNVNLINKGLMLQEEFIFNAYEAITVSSATEEAKRRAYRKVSVARDIANKIREQLFI